MTIERCQSCGSFNIAPTRVDFTCITYLCGDCLSEWDYPDTKDSNMETKINDNVNHPKHYANGMTTEVECIMFTRNMGFDAGNAFKYIWRAGNKDALKQELEKAMWYLEDMLEYGIKEKHTEFVCFLPKSSLEQWKYEALRYILTGSIDEAIKVIADVGINTTHLIP